MTKIIQINIKMSIFQTIYIYIYMKLIYLNFLLEFNIQIFLFKSLSKLSYSCLAHLITQYPNPIYHL